MDRIVIDTNVVISVLSQRLGYKDIFESFINQKFIWCYSTEILLEYIEKMQEFFTRNTIETFIQALLKMENTLQISPQFKYNLLQDADDNKFVDCAFAANAKYLVTNDKGFSVLNNLAFPKIEIIDIDRFTQYLTK